MSGYSTFLTETKAPARSRGREEYLLTTKLFCGYCREMMTGYGGTGKSGMAYRYYACKSAKKKPAERKLSISRKSRTGLF